MVLVRTTGFDRRVRAFAEELQVRSGHRVAFVADARHASASEEAYPVLGISREACETMGLYCPEEFVWRCGDYGYYLARQRFPDITHFWMVENDVRFYGDDIAAFFRFFNAQQQVDLLATGLESTDRSWHWTATARARDVRPYRCLFPVTRLSARAIDAALDRRVRQSRRFLRRSLWPNDEALVATTIMNREFVGRDFNDFGQTFYDPETFSFTNPIDGDRFTPEISTVRMYHPVLFGQAYETKVAKVKRMGPDPWLQRKWRRVRSELAGLSRW